MKKQLITLLSLLLCGFVFAQRVPLYSEVEKTLPDGTTVKLEFESIDEYQYDENGNISTLFHNYNYRTDYEYSYSNTKEWSHSVEVKYNYEAWQDFDDKGNLIHFKNTNGKEDIYEYDERSNKIHYIHYSYGDIEQEEWWQYDSFNNMTYYKIQYRNGSTNEQWWKYDSRKRLVFYKNDKYCQETYTFDDEKLKFTYKYESLPYTMKKNGKEVKTEGSSWGYKGTLDSVHHMPYELKNMFQKAITEYDDNLRLIHAKENGREIWTEYNENGDIIHEKEVPGEECWYEYDSNGNEIHSKSINGNEIWESWRIYNEHGDEVLYKDSDGEIIYYECEYYDNGLKKSESMYKN